MSATRNASTPAAAKTAGEIRTFADRKDWAKWLDKNHRKADGLWLRIAKKGTGLQSVTYQEALEVALCYGWIDGQKRPENAECWLQRFARRGPRSLWSKINREKAATLIESGEMKPAGLEAIESAKANGRWEAAYDSMTGAAVPEDLQTALEASPTAKAFFETLDKTNRYSVLWRIQTVKKTETRARKIAQYIAMLERREKVHE